MPAFNPRGLPTHKGKPGYHRCLSHYLTECQEPHKDIGQTRLYHHPGSEHRVHHRDLTIARNRYTDHHPISESYYVLPTSSYVPNPHPGHIRGMTCTAQRIPGYSVMVWSGVYVMPERVRLERNRVTASTVMGTRKGPKESITCRRSIGGRSRDSVRCGV